MRGVLSEGGDFACGCGKEGLPREVLCLMDPVFAQDRMKELGGMARAVAAGKRAPFTAFWRVLPALVAARSETRLPAYASAAAKLASIAWPVAVRDSGGAAFPVSLGTLQITLATHRDAVDCGTHQPTFETMYQALAQPILDGLAAMSVDARIGEVGNSFCAGRFDIAIDGRKVGGLAQRWSGDGAIIVEASMILDAQPLELARTVNAFYAWAGSKTRCDPAACTSLRDALPSGAGDPTSVFIAAFRKAME